MAGKNNKDKGPLSFSGVGGGGGLALTLLPPPPPPHVIVHANTYRLSSRVYSICLYKKEYRLQLLHQFSHIQKLKLIKHKQTRQRLKEKMYNRQRGCYIIIRLRRYNKYSRKSCLLYCCLSVA